MKRFLKEPLLHFLLLGAGLFLAFGLMPKGPGSSEPGKIVVTQGQIEHLATGFAKTWQRPPTAQELEGLVRDWVREEVYYREAMALGLDKDDTVIRRRLRQKMEFVSEDVAAQAEPSDADLTAYVQTHPDAFRVEQKYTFRQVYLDPVKRGEALATDVTKLIAQLNADGKSSDATALGDSFLLDPQFDAVPASEIAKRFGNEFATRLGELPAGQWQGPVESGYGVHLVLVTERTQARLPELSEVRDAAKREWTNAKRLEANEKFYETLLKNYVVTIERLQVAEEKNSPAEITK